MPRMSSSAGARCPYTHFPDCVPSLPVISPDLVTCPTKKSGMDSVLAARNRAVVDSRTCRRTRSQTLACAGGKSSKSPHNFHPLQGNLKGSTSLPKKERQ